MSTLIAAIFHVLGTTYLYNRILAKKIFSNCKASLFFVMVSVMIIGTFIILTHTPLIFPFLFILLSSISMYIIYKNKFDLCIIVIILSRALYHTMYTLITLLLTLISIPLFYLEIEIPYLLLITLSEFLTLLCLILLFKIKRLRNGMPFLTNSRFIHFGVGISFFILFLRTLDETDATTSIPESIIPFTLFLLAFLLFAWWRNQITKSYIEKLRKLELQSLYEEVEEKNKRIDKLVADNDALAHIIHKDNKLIPAMESAVCDFLLLEGISDIDEVRPHGKQLVERLQTMTQDRKGILESYHNQSMTLHQTGNVGIDAMLAYMQKRADEKNTTLSCKHTKETLDYLLQTVSEEDVCHLLSDLIENALIATQTAEQRKIQIVFGKYQKEAFISVADTGTPFEIDTLHHYGMHAHTTHKDEGGSGIGLLDIWNLKKKYKASIQIQEYDAHKDQFTKKITLSFNRKNHYVIQSFRYTDIVNTQTRGDLYVIPYEKNTIKGGALT